MYRIKAIQPDGSELTIYDPVGAGALPVIGPRISEEINEASTLEFSLVYGHPAYGLLEPKKTYITVELLGEEIYFGRVVNAEPSPMTGQTQYSCAGALSFLQDSEVPPDGKKSDGSSDFKTMTAEAFLQRCVTAHNNDVGSDPRRLFTIGIVNHSRKDERREYRISSYQDTKSVIEQNLLNYYGGFLRVRRENGGLLLDWLEDDYGDTDASVLDLGENIISLLHRMTGEDLYTAIRPVGQNGLVLSGGETVDLFPSADMGQYGKIVRSISFPDAANVNALRTKAQEYVDKLQKTLSISSDVKLLDMKFVDGVSHGVNLGDKFTNIVGLEGVPLLVSARNRDIENPQNDSCTLKNKKAYEGTDSTEKESGSSTLSKRSSRNSAAGGYAYKHIHEYGEKLELNAKEISILGDQVEIHADQLVETANEFVRLSRKDGEQDIRFGIIEGTGVFQNSEHITQIAGKFHYDETTGAVELIDGTEFKIHDRDGAMITVGTRLNELGGKVANIEGSALWTQRNNITGVVGEFDIVTNQDGTRSLVVKSGGGIKIRRDNTEFGLYDNGTLTAGIICNKINGASSAKIYGSHVTIEGDTTIEGWLGIESGSLKVKGAAIIDGNLTMTSGKEIFAGNIRATDIRFPGSNPGEDAHLTRSVVAAMLVKAEVSGNVLKITDNSGHEVTFSKATSLSGTWGGDTSGSTNNYTVTASPSGATHSVSVNVRISGTAQYSNFSAEAGGYDQSGNFSRRMFCRGYLVETVSGSSSYVDVRKDSEDGTTVARLSTSATYAAGNTYGYNRAHVTGSWSNNVFTYSKTTSGSSNSASVTINSAVAMQQGVCYAYATKTGSDGNTTSVAGTSKIVTIVNSNDNAVKLQLAGSDVGLTFSHGKYTAGYNKGYSDAKASLYSWIAIVNAAGSNHQGTLGYNTYIALVDGNGNNTGNTWLTPKNSTPSYSFSNISSGNDCPSSNVSSFLAGYTLHKRTIGARQNYYYQYIKFSIDGRKHAFYW